MESILRVRNYNEILPDACYEQALEMFLTEYPNREMRRGKLCPSGYATSSKAIAQAKNLTSKDSDDEMNKDGENETAPEVFLERT